MPGAYTRNICTLIILEAAATRQLLTGISPIHFRKMYACVHVVSPRLSGQLSRFCSQYIVIHKWHWLEHQDCQLILTTSEFAFVSKVQKRKRYDVEKHKTIPNMKMKRDDQGKVKRKEKERHSESNGSRPNDTEKERESVRLSE